MAVQIMTIQAALKEEQEKLHFEVCYLVDVHTDNLMFSVIVTLLVLVLQCFRTSSLAGRGLVVLLGRQ